MPTSFTDDLRLAHVLADDADSLSTDRYQSLDLQVDTKPDLSPVTDADRAVEEGIRRTLGRARPRDAILGEEQGSTGFSQRRWVVDPIDGTKNFVRGVPVWATLISLMVEDEVVVGVVSAPQLNRRWWAMKDGGAFTGRSLLKPVPIRVSDVSRLEDASFSYSSLDGWDHAGRLDDFLTLSRHSWRTRAYGDFWSHMLVAEGAVDFAAEPELELYDMAALDVIVREAGGRFTSLDGRDGPHGGNALASNGILHETVLGFLGSVGPDSRPSADGGPAGAAGSDRGGPTTDPQDNPDGQATGDRSTARAGSAATREPGGTLHQLSDRRRPAPTGQGPDLPPM
jgi:histidinol-phosphatase